MPLEHVLSMKESSCTDEGHIKRVALLLNTFVCILKNTFCLKTTYIVKSNMKRYQNGCCQFKVPYYLIYPFPSFAEKQKLIRNYFLYKDIFRGRHMSLIAQRIHFYKYQNTPKQNLHNS